MSALMTTYARLPVTFSHGKGVYLYDTEENRYLDGIAGIGVNSLGHAHPGVTKTIQEQAAKLIHTSNLYKVEPQEQLAETLTSLTGMDNCFFANSGAEANEAALKLARLHGHHQNINKPSIIVMDGAFHGRTLATLTATSNRKIQAGFEPLVAGFVRAPLNDIAALQQIAQNNPNVVAILMEPIQGEGGILMADTAYLQAVRQLCDEQNWLMMLDEVQTGNGRTGSYFTYQKLGFSPDVVTTAKGLGNGVPIGVCMARGPAAEIFAPGQHGSTYGGNPLACATASTVIETIVSEKLCDNATAMGAVIKETFLAEMKDSPQIVDVRGRGLMIGIELNADCPELVQRAMEHKILLNVTAGRTVRLLPPLVINTSEAQQLAVLLADSIKSLG
jgi:acetylornithine/N-succinyldiaminopimelate aminotransferase